MERHMLLQISLPQGSTVPRPVVRGAKCVAERNAATACLRRGSIASPHTSARQTLHPRCVALPDTRGTAELSRRSMGGMLLRSGFLLSSVPVATGLVPPAGATSIRTLVLRGQERFQKGDIEGSLQEFDRALQMDPTVKPYLWQRGLSLYYANRFSDALAQFTEDVRVNPNDTEESIWAFLSAAQLTGFEDARKNMLTVGRDRRPIMRSAYETFKEADNPEHLLRLGEKSYPSGGSDSFYSKLYAALFYEARNDAEAARLNMTDAVQTPYAQRSGDYMASLAMVHCQQRGWSV